MKSKNLIYTLFKLSFLVFILGCGPQSNNEVDDATKDHPDDKLLVDAEWLKIKQATNPALILAKVGWGEPLGGFIPGSIYINTDEIEYDEFRPRATTVASELERTTTVAQDAAKGLSEWDSLPKNWWNLYPDEYLLKALAYMGFTTASETVLYGRSPESVARLAWCLIYVGVEEVYFLDLGINAWIEAGYDTTNRAIERNPVEQFGVSTAANPQYKASTSFISQLVAGSQSEAILVDVRTYQEHIGKTNPYSYFSAKGNIPNSIYGGAGNDNWSMKGYYGPDNKLNSLGQVDSMWQVAGINSDKTVGFYCGTGWRSSVAWLFAYRMGWDNIKNYDGSWYEWSWREEK